MTAPSVCVCLCMHVCVCVCVPVCRPCLHYCTYPDVTLGNAMGCPLVVHYWADLQSVHGQISLLWQHTCLMQNVNVTFPASGHHCPSEQAMGHGSMGQMGHCFRWVTWVMGHIMFTHDPPTSDELSIQ